MSENAISVVSAGFVFLYFWLRDRQKAGRVTIPLWIDVLARLAVAFAILWLAVVFLRALGGPHPECPPGTLPDNC